MLGSVLESDSRTTENPLPRLAHARAKQRRRCGWLAASALLVLNGCSILLDFDDSNQGPPVDAIPDEAASALEPNDSMAEAKQIFGGRIVNIGLSPGNEKDFYSFNLSETSEITLDVLPVVTDAAASLNVKLYDPDGQEIASAVSGTRIAFEGTNALEVGTGYIVEIAASGGRENIYTINLGITTAPSPSP